MRPIIKECRKIAKSYEVKVRFRKMKGDLAGQSELENERVIINSALSSRQEILSCLMHEIAHILAYRKGVWRAYHESADPKTALKAERYIDREAENMLYAYDKRIRYLGYYADSCDKDAKEFLKDYYGDSFGG